MSASRPPLRTLQVVRTMRRTPRMQRITLGGAELAGFPAGCEGAHIKLLFPDDAGRTHVRTYTVAGLDALALELDVDIVLHGDGGPASRWASRACAGAAIGLIGPGGPALYRPHAQRFLLLGDSSSYALVHGVMGKLPAGAEGDVLMLVPHVEEILPLPLRDRMRVQWLLEREDAWLDALASLPRPSAEVSVTLAGESAQVIAVRDFLVHQWQVRRDMMYAVPYWKRDVDEDAYHDERHRIMDAFEVEAA